MSANGRAEGMLFAADVGACPCGVHFARRFPGERFCSNRCAGTVEAKLPAATVGRPEQKPTAAPVAPARPRPEPEPDFASPVAVPLAIERSRRWSWEHRNTKWPS